MSIPNAVHEVKRTLRQLGNFPLFIITASRCPMKDGTRSNLHRQTRRTNTPNPILAPSVNFLSQFRANFALDPHTGIYSSSVVSPTGLPADVPLVSYGEDQARQLADHLVTLEPAVSRIYSSPYCRCLQTLAPAVAKLREAGVWEGRVRGENGIG